MRCSLVLMEANDPGAAGYGECSDESLEKQEVRTSRSSVAQDPVYRGKASSAGPEVRRVKGCGQNAGEDTREDRGKDARSAARAGVVSLLQAGMGGNRGAVGEPAGHAFCLPILPVFAPRAWSGKRFS
jgi:hypothetical protein